MFGAGATIFHAGAWLLWLVVAMLGALLTRNPWYLAVVIVASLLVNRALSRARTDESTGEPGATNLPTSFGQGGAAGRASFLLVRAVVGLLLLVTLFKGFSLHVGATVLFRLPDEWPLFGGPITLEGLAYSALDALQLLAVLAVFTAFSRGADYYALLRSVPAFMHQVALITSIAITFVPQTVTRFAEIREAQALRGHRVRRMGDLIPIVIPLLAGGMERSMNLAEAMEARGFSRNPPGARTMPPILVQSGIVAGFGLVLVGGAALAFFASAPWVGWSGIVAGLALMGGTLWAVSARSKRTRYRRGTWRDIDTVLALCSAAIGAILLMYRFAVPLALIYDPLSKLRIYVPPFDPVLALALAALAAPVLVLAGRKRQAGAKIDTSD